MVQRSTIPGAYDAPCGFPVRQCLTQHVLPHLRHAQPDGNGWHAQCPAPGHGAGDKDNLSVAAGEHQVVYYCHAGHDQLELRAGLIASGVHDQCIPLSRSDREARDALLRGYLTANIPLAARVLLALNLIDSGQRKLPSGAGLEALAGAAKLHRATAYRAVKGAKNVR